MGFVELIIQLRNIRKDNIAEKKRFITEIYNKGCEVAEDFYQILKECEINTRNIRINPDDIICDIELRREKMHARRQEARAMLQLTYWDKNTMYKRMVYGLSVILCGDNADIYMQIAGHDYERNGHTLLDIISRYEGIKIYCNNDRDLIMDELRRIINCQYSAVEKGVKEMTESYVRIIEELDRKLL